MTTAEIADFLVSNGYSYQPRGSHRARVRQRLNEQSCFWEAAHRELKRVVPAITTGPMP